MGMDPPYVARRAMRLLHFGIQPMSNEPLSHSLFLSVHFSNAYFTRYIPAPRDRRSGEAGEPRTSRALNFNETIRPLEKARQSTNAGRREQPFASMPVRMKYRIVRRCATYTSRSRDLSRYSLRITWCKVLLEESRDASLENFIKTQTHTWCEEVRSGKSELNFACASLNSSRLYHGIAHELFLCNPHGSLDYPQIQKIIFFGSFWDFKSFMMLLLDIKDVKDFDHDMDRSWT